MNVNFYIWRPILARICTLEELDRHWTLCDLADAHEALDIKEEAEQYYADKARND